jgi:tetratricopeptide (TPR) repeat protein
MVAPRPEVEAVPAVESHIRAIARDEVQQELGEVRLVSSLALAESKDAARTADSKVALIVGLMQTFIGLIVLFFAFAAFMGFAEWRRIKALREKAEATASLSAEIAQRAADRATAATTAAEAAASGIREMKENLNHSWAQINESFDRLPDPDRYGLIGIEAPPLAPSICSVFEDHDGLLLVCDRLGIVGDNAKCADYLGKLGLYWRLRKNFERANARLVRAVELAPNDPDILREYAMMLAHWAAESRGGIPSERDERLKLALEAMKKAHEISGGQDAKFFHAIGWVYDETGEYPKAIEAYKRAKELAGAERWRYTYDLACSLSKAGDFEGALKELQDAGPRAAALAIEDDPDFSALSRAPEFQSRFKKVIDELRAGVV